MKDRPETSYTLHGQFDVPLFLKQLGGDMRASINEVFGSVELISHEDISPEISRSLDDIRRHAADAMRLTDTVSELVRISSDDFEPEEKDYCFEDLAIDVRTAAEQAAARKGLDTEVEIDPDIPFGLKGDCRRIVDMLSKILIGAAEHTEAGTIRFSAECTSTEDGIAQLVFTVGDSGSGILSTGIVSALSGGYTDVSVLSESDRINYAGVLITKYLAAKMEGSLVADAVPDRGTVFTLTIRQKITDSTSLGEHYRRLEQELDRRAKEGGLRKDEPEGVPDPEGPDPLTELGVNLQTAFMNYGGTREEFRESLLNACRSSDTKAKMLGYYLEQHDYRNYLTALEGITTILDILGAEEPFRKAKRLEYAAKQGEREVIEAETAGFAEEFDKLLTSIRSVIMSQDKVVSKGLIDRDDLIVIIYELRGYLDEYRISEVETLFYSLTQFSYPNDRVMELIHEAEEQFLDYNYNEIGAILDEVIQELYAEQG